MRVRKMNKTFVNLLILLWTNLAHCSISGISYMDPISAIRSKLPPGTDPCNPLYWYPRNIPKYCYLANTKRPEPPANTLPPAPAIVPMPPLPLPVLPPSIPIFPPPVPILPIPSPPIIAGPPPLPLFPVPPPAPMISISSNPYSYSNINPINAFHSQSSSNSFPYYPSLQRSPTGFVPGMHDLVTKDGGINIMPFSDAYADMFEKHKNKMIRRKLNKILDKYDPYSRHYRHLRKYEKYFTDEK